MGTRARQAEPMHLYAAPEYYEPKLKRVMMRLGIEEENFSWDFSRTSAVVEFTYKGAKYKFEHSLEKAASHGQKLNYGTDCFAKIVLSLERLALMVEDGIYDLQTWVAGMKFLPEKSEFQIPPFFKYMGFDHIPVNVDEVNKQYRRVVSSFHPDTGGTDESFNELQSARELALNYFGADKK